jgi:hypothetical protein
MISFLSLKTYNYRKPLGREGTSGVIGILCRVWYWRQSFLAILRFGITQYSLHWPPGSSMGTTKSLMTLPYINYEF